MDGFNYAETELRKLGAIGPDDTVRVKLTTDKGETRWLSVDISVYRKIALALVKGEQQ